MVSSLQIIQIQIFYISIAEIWYFKQKISSKYYFLVYQICCNIASKMQKLYCNTQDFKLSHYLVIKKLNAFKEFVFHTHFICNLHLLFTASSLRTMSLQKIVVIVPKNFFKSCCMIFFIQLSFYAKTLDSSQAKEWF